MTQGQTENKMDAVAWKSKAMAFVTRSHRHLWGKNNEDPQAFLFLQGLKNQFVKELLLGWNKFGQDRPMDLSVQSLVKATGSAFIFSSDKREDRLNRQVFSTVQDACFYTCQSKEELKALCLKN